MADRAVPDAFANDLTGVYATDPDYGANLIALMKLYNLYQFDSAGAPAQAATTATAATAAPTATGHAAASPAASRVTRRHADKRPRAHQCRPGNRDAAVPGVTAPAPAASPAAPRGRRASSPRARRRTQGNLARLRPRGRHPALAPSVPA